MEKTHDWEIIAQSEPYLGVLTHERYRSANIDPDSLDQFYATGRDKVNWIHNILSQQFGFQRARRALDFGCGVGRLTFGMNAYADTVFGLDVSQTMVDLATARARATNIETAQYAVSLPEGTFDWINSFIVFQHIPPDEGMARLEELLERAESNCCLSLHFTFWREDHLNPRKSRIDSLLDWAARHLSSSPKSPIDQLIAMYDYNLSDVYKTLTQHGFSNVRLVHENHGGHHGAWLLSRRR